MSQSPAPDAPAEAMRAYDTGWVATNRLIREGRSFSGNEQHCVFLNTGDRKSFANISALTGLDLPEDGRGLALADWDHDGRIDFWVTNRTGPRVRFFRNTLEAGRFVALRLEGAEANRDAIGARVTIELEGSPLLTKTLYAGSGFLSQSSKWLHFGLGFGEEPILRVTVRWPGGREESFSGVAPGGHFRLRQGSGRAVKWDPPAVDPQLFEVEPEAPESSAPGSRVVFLAPAPLPETLAYRDAEGVERKLPEAFGAPLLLQFWATWCPDCEAEMEGWKNHAAAVRAAGLKVLALCVDEPGDDREADLRKALEVARQRGYPFPVGLATTELVETLNIFQKAFLGRQTDLPLPTSFLIDAQGRLSALYKGPADPERVLADQKVCGAAFDQILSTAIPFPGRWLHLPEPTVPRRVALRLTEHGLLDQSAAYLRQILPLYEATPDGESPEGAETRRAEAAECHHFLGAIHSDKNEPEEAERHYRKALSFNSSKIKTRRELVRVCLTLDKKAEAAEQLEAILDDNREDFESLMALAGLRAESPETAAAASLYQEALAMRGQSPDAHYRLANLLRDSGRAGEAITHYRKALEFRPGWPLPANNLAWILSTHPDAALRDGREAVRLATLANDATGNSLPPLLGTLAAAHAEAGDFEKATAIIATASAAALKHKETDLAERLEKKRVLYGQGKPFRDAGLAPADRK